MLTELTSQHPSTVNSEQWRGMLPIMAHSVVFVYYVFLVHVNSDAYSMLYTALMKTSTTD